MFQSVVLCIGLALIGAVMAVPLIAVAEPTAVAGPPMPEVPASTRPAPQNFVEPIGTLTLPKALSLALARNPRLASFAWNIRVAEADMMQAGSIPNPEIEAAIEEFGGSDTRRGFEGAETTLALSQLIELGGKRTKRLRVATLGRDLSRWDYEAARLDVLTDTLNAFAAVLSAQRQLALAQESQELAQQVLATVAARVQAGKVSPLEESRAGVALSRGRIALERAERELAAARRRLAAMWGSEEAAFAQAEGPYERITQIPPLEALLADIERNPDLARWVTEMERRRAALELEKARRIPDPVVSAGVTRFEETDDNAVLLSLSIPLPVFGLNPGRVAAARAALMQGLEERRAAEMGVRSALAETYASLAAAHAEVRTLQNDILPSAERTYAAIREGYRAGKFGFLDVLDAQRTLFEARQDYVDALATYHSALAGTERLVGRPVAMTAGTGEVE